MVLPPPHLPVVPPPQLEALQPQVVVLQPQMVVPQLLPVVLPVPAVAHLAAVHLLQVGPPLPTAAHLGAVRLLPVVPPLLPVAHLAAVRLLPVVPRLLAVVPPLLPVAHLEAVRLLLVVPHPRPPEVQPLQPVVLLLLAAALPLAEPPVTALLVPLHLATPLVLPASLVDRLRATLTGPPPQEVPPARPTNPATCLVMARTALVAVALVALQPPSLPTQVSSPGCSPLRLPPSPSKPILRSLL